MIKTTVALFFLVIFTLYAMGQLGVVPMNGSKSEDIFASLKTYASNIGDKIKTTSQDRVEVSLDKVEAKLDQATETTTAKSFTERVTNRVKQAQ